MFCLIRIVSHDLLEGEFHQDFRPSQRCCFLRKNNNTKQTEKTTLPGTLDKMQHLFLPSQMFLALHHPLCVLCYDSTSVFI